MNSYISIYWYQVAENRNIWNIIYVWEIERCSQVKQKKTKEDELQVTNKNGKCCCLYTLTMWLAIIIIIIKTTFNDLKDNKTVKEDYEQQVTNKNGSIVVLIE